MILRRRSSDETLHRRSSGAFRRAALRAEVRQSAFRRAAARLPRPRLPRRHGNPSGLVSHHGPSRPLQRARVRRHDGEDLPSLRLGRSSEQGVSARDPRVRQGRAPRARGRTGRHRLHWNGAGRDRHPTPHARHAGGPPRHRDAAVEGHQVALRRLRGRASLRLRPVQGGRRRLSRRHTRPYRRSGHPRAEQLSLRADNLARQENALRLLLSRRRVLLLRHRVENVRAARQMDGEACLPRS